MAGAEDVRARQTARASWLLLVSDVCVCCVDFTHCTAAQSDCVRLDHCGFEECLQETPMPLPPLLSDDDLGDSCFVFLISYFLHPVN